MLAENNPEILRAVGVLLELSADERTRMLYDEREKAWRDNKARMDGAFGQGSKMMSVQFLLMGTSFRSIFQSISTCFTPTIWAITGNTKLNL